MGKHGGSPGGHGSSAEELLIKKVCEKFSTDINRKLDQIHVDISSLKTSIESIGAKVESNICQIHELDERCDLLEQQSKKNTLRLNGLPEAQNECVLRSIVDLLQRKLNITCNPQEIDYAFRVGHPKSTTNQPRTIIVRFVNFQRKSEIMASKKSLKGSNITIFDDLTKQRFDLLKECKKKYGKQAWSTGGRIFIWSPTQDKKIEIKSLSDL